MRRAPTTPIRVLGLTAVAALALTTTQAHAAPTARTQTTAAARAAAVDTTVLLGGLNSARAVDVEPSGNLIGAGLGRGGVPTLARYYTSGPRAGNLVRIASLPDVPSDVAAGPAGSIWVLFGGTPEEGPPPAGSPARTLYRYQPGASPALTMVADLGAYAAAHPDPYDLEGNPADSNPYGLAALPGGGVLVADAAANALVRVSTSGTVSTVARFPVQVVSTAEATALGTPGLPPTLPAEAVPTSVVVGPDGNWYVGELKGFPFQPGTSKVWKIRAGSKNLRPTPTSRFSTSGAAVYADGLTSIVDLAVGRSGATYALEFAKDGVGAVEAAPPDAPPVPAVLLKQLRGVRTEIGFGSLFLPGSVATDKVTGAVYVTDLFLVPGQGRLLRLE